MRREHVVFEQRSSMPKARQSVSEPWNNGGAGRCVTSCPANDGEEGRADVLGEFTRGYVEFREDFLNERRTVAAVVIWRARRWAGFHGVGVV